MSERTILVAGVHGISGLAAAEHWSRRADATVYGLSRRVAPLPDGIRPLQADLMDVAATREALEAVGGFTHVVFAAYVEKASVAERSKVNVALLRSFLDAVEPVSPTLEHVLFYQGGGAYGADLGPFKTPGREDDPRLLSPNFYFDQEDAIRARQEGKAWSWTALRPEAVSGFAVGNPMNLAMVIAVYAVICKELGVPMRFPGSDASWRALYQVTSADILGSASVWAAEDERARNEVFNITNGDCFRWQHIWPRIAAMFDMDAASPLHMPLAAIMADKGPVWDRVVQRYGLHPYSFEEIVSWPFGDAIFAMGHDNITSTVKARQAGFDDCIDTEEMFRTLFDRLRARKIIPPRH